MVGARLYARGAFGGIDDAGVHETHAALGKLCDKDLRHHGLDRRLGAFR